MSRERATLSLACVLLGAFAGPAENPRAASQSWGRTARPAVATAPSPAVGPLFDPHHPSGVEPAAKPLSEQERLQQDLLHTDRLIRVLRAKIHRSGNSGAQDRFREAMERERHAREAFVQSHFARSSRLTHEARTLAREAAVMVGPPEEDPAYVGRMLARAGEALTLAHEVFDQGAGSSIWKRYNALKNDLTRARGLHKEGDTREAYRMALEVRNSVLDLLTEAENLPIPAPTASKAVRRVEHALKRASKELGPHPKEAAAAWHEEASGYLAKAKQSYGRKDYRNTMIYSKLALRVLDRAVTAQRNGVKSAAS